MTKRDWVRSALLNAQTASRFWQGMRATAGRLDIRELEPKFEAASLALAEIEIFIRKRMEQ